MGWSNRQNLETLNQKTALHDWFKYYFQSLQVGLIMSIAGSAHLKSGTGKSYTAVKIGEQEDKDYLNGTTAIDKIAWRPRDFGRAMQMVEDTDKAGQIVIVDEAGILVNAKKWYSFINRGIADAVMTFRQLRSMAIFVTPAFNFIEKDVRTFVSHLGFTDKMMEGNRQVVNFHLYQLFWDESKPLYYKYRLCMYLKEHERLVKFKYFRVKMPVNQELLDAYEKKARIYKSEIRNAVLELDKIDRNYMEYVVDILEKGEIIKETKLGQKHVYVEDIRETYGITASMALMVARRVNEKLHWQETAGNKNGVSN